MQRFLRMVEKSERVLLIVLLLVLLANIASALWLLRALP